MTNWFAVMATPTKERLATRMLEAQGLSVFWPHFLAEVRQGTRRGYAFRSWIAPYLFVTSGSRDFNSYTVNNTMGVSTLVYSGDKPLRIPTDLIWDLKSLAEPDGLIPSATVKLKPKNMVTITGENLIQCLKQLRGLKTKVWARGMRAA